jgi:hypothetical protein
LTVGPIGGEAQPLSTAITANPTEAVLIRFNINLLDAGLSPAMVGAT